MDQQTFESLKFVDTQLELIDDIAPNCGAKMDGGIQKQC